jgi:uncharacterized membrane protein HdeD (DUF308 family)
VIQLRKEIKGEWPLILSGMLSISIACGIGLIAQPDAGAFAVVWHIAT